MHWAYKIATELINKYPNKETFVCASGISPSGSVHIGNFREVITTYFVVKALQDLGKKTRFIFSWDDFDRFRKVPNNVDAEFQQYIGKSYDNIPDPFGCHHSYAEHFEAEFEDSLKVFGIEIEFIYQHSAYTSGKYNKQILHALKQRKEIYDILMEFKTSQSSNHDRDAFYPLTIYCKKCGKDDTKIILFEEEQEEIKYECLCGFQHQIKIMEANNIKLNWKVDWPMRWMMEDVIFEPGGRDHSSETGSYNVSKEIAKRIFHFEAPDYTPYEFIGIKGHNGKMSSSTGNNITPNELLNIYIPEIILFMFAKYKPSTAFNIGTDEDVLKNYTEYERYIVNNLNRSLEDEDIKYALELSHSNKTLSRLPKFSLIASVLPLVNYNVQLLQKILEKNGEKYDIQTIKKISNRAEYWIKHCYPIKNIVVNQNKASDLFQTLNDEQRNWIYQLQEYIALTNNSDSQLMQKIYAICQHHDKKIMKANQKQFFTLVYKLILNSPSGPPFPILIQAIGKDKTLDLLDFQ
ncbi:lysine--tRNA ligase [Gottfriedia solisilvae]|uniref:Lysine--tRNA ligase n=1 Tax=Gottfriedia solisilvae TaxID=1516104 RepID=A0A8J3EXG6_9BACI|nr:lysine--tRNA ligase [Gottfriedia solisilvae]GGI13147.1 lysine--tRNA ligase [Gottfriedia solisilvae]